MTTVMPYELRRRGSRYDVVNPATGRVHARGTTKAKAQAQIRLLESIDSGERKPDKVKRLKNGTKVNVYIKRG